jgi:hypothetical protein
MIVCIVVAAILIAIGLIFRRNSPEDGDPVKDAYAAVGVRRKKGIRLPKNAGSYFTIILALAALVLFFVLSKR